ncbi:MAG: glycosyltransferase, partial [Alphaproteobacteria bacterium]|nr:glycosyltransferase [Alphaproteobacteria bacterium]
LTVLQLATDLEATATTRLLFDLVNALSAADARPFVASAGGRMKGELQTKGGVELAFPTQAKNPLAMALNCRRLADVIKSERVDLVHVRSRALAWVAFGACRVTKTPLVTSFEAGTKEYRAVARRYNSILARGDLVLTSSRFAAELAARLYPAAADKIRMVPPGVDCQIFDPGKVSPDRVAAIRRHWKVAPHEQIILIAISPDSTGRGQSLVEATRLLAASGLSGVKFIVDRQMSGQDRALERAIVRQGLQGLMDLAEERDRPAAYLAASAVVSLGQAKAATEIALQAQAMGTPVIAASRGPASEMILAPPKVEEGLRTGFLVKPGDGASLAIAIARILGLGASAGAALSCRARQYVETHFSTEQFCAATLAAYGSLIALRRGVVEDNEPEPDAMFRVASTRAEATSRFRAGCERVGTGFFAEIPRLKFLESITFHDFGPVDSKSS